MKASYREAQGQKFWFVDFGSEVHGRTSFRLWVSERLLQDAEDGGKELTFPVVNTQIITTGKGSLVLKPGKGVVYDVYVRSGYRGGAEIELLTPVVKELPYRVYHSARGSLGVSEGKLVFLSQASPLSFRWKRTGRLYGEPSQGITTLYPDGKVEELDQLPDGLEALEELKAELE